MCHSLQEKEKEAASVWCGPRSLEQNENSSQKLANFCPFGLEVSKSNKQKVERRWSWAGPGLVETQTDALFAFLLPGSRHTPGTPPTHTPRGQQGHCQPPFRAEGCNRRFLAPLKIRQQFNFRLLSSLVCHLGSPFQDHCSCHTLRIRNDPKASRRWGWEASTWTWTKWTCN